MLHTIIKRLEICIDINIGLSLADHYTWIFTSGIFRLVLEITFFLASIFSCKWLTSYSHKVKNLINRGILIRTEGGGGIGKFFEKKISRGGRLLGIRE